MGHREEKLAGEIEFHRRSLPGSATTNFEHLQRVVRVFNENCCKNILDVWFERSGISIFLLTSLSYLVSGSARSSSPMSEVGDRATVSVWASLKASVSAVAPDS